jgi:hypothetical protein
MDIQGVGCYEISIYMDIYNLYAIRAITPSALLV